VSTRVTLTEITGSIRVKCEGQYGAQWRIRSRTKHS